MQEDQIIVGLDIGTTKICAMVGRLNEFGKLEILGMGKAVSDGVKEGTVSNINKTVAAIHKAIKDAEDDAKIDVGVINVGIAGKHINSSEQQGSITLESQDHEVTAGDVKKLTGDMYRLVVPPGSKIIHVMSQHYKLDDEEHIIDPIGMAGAKLEGNFHVVTAQTNAIRNINKCVERVGLEIDNMILEPLASSLAVLTEEEKEAGVALVDIGGGTTDIAVFHDNIIRHTAVLPFGGNIITSDIKQGCSVLQNQAEQLKVKFGKSLALEASESEVISIPGLRSRPAKEISIKNLAYIIEARMEEIIDLVMLEIERSGYRNRLAGGIVITGGGSQLKNIRQLVEYKTGLDARIGYPNEHLGKGKHDNVKEPMYATSIGLLLAGFQDLREIESKSQNDNDNVSFKQKGQKSGDLFKTIIKKTKELLIDDFDDKSNY